MEPWYKSAIVYAVDLHRVADGTFAGLTRRLDHLAELGVTCLWLLPFYASPDRDNGYDVKDYLSVDPRFGTLDDFEACLRAAGERGLRVVLDLPVNHTSDQHPWFQAARRDPASRYRDFYIWCVNPPPPEAGHQSIFPGEESTVWTFDERAQAYYYHRFYRFQPELNIANADVRDEIRRIMDFWLAFPIAGFRVDAASHMIEDRGVKGTAPKGGHDVLKEFSRFAAQRRPGTVLIGEADVPLDQAAAFFGDGDELHLIFNFLLDNDLFLALADESAAPVARCLRELPSIPDGGQWLNFLRNLDELDLERLTDEERQRVYRAFAPDESMRIYGRGIRRRIAPMLDQNRARLELAWSLLFAMPGTPMIAYGDEIGLGEDLSRTGRDAVRLPMPWDEVERQRADGASLFSWFKRAIAARRRCTELGLGRYEVIATDEPAVLAHVVDWKGQRVLAVHNLADEEREPQLDLSGHGGGEIEPVFGEAKIMGTGERCRVRLAPYGYGWFRMKAAG